ncbi:MAG TPA: hypothetical protein VKB25_09050 [Conexibacter sp.]|nr:hypothetical protein [Conexibacter sp.]
MRFPLVLAAALLLLLSAAAAPLAASAADPLSRVTVDRGAAERLGHFRDTADGATFVPRGNNYVRLAQAPGGAAYHSTFEPGQYDAGRVDAALAEMQGDGYNTVRVFVDPGSIGDANAGHPHGLGRGVDDHGTLYGPYMDNVADFIRRADDRCVRVVVTLDGFPENAHYYTEVTKRPVSPDIGGPNLMVLDAMHVEAREAYVGDFVRGLRDRLGADRLSAVFAYQIDNEAYVVADAKPFAGGPAQVTTANGRTYDMTSFGAGGDRQRAVDDGFAYVANRLAAAIRSVDPAALVTMGVYTHAAVGQGGPNGIVQATPDNRRPARPALLARDSTLSFLDVHLYPTEQPNGVNQPYTVDGDLSSSEWAGIAGKPVVIGELGAVKSFWGDDLNAAAYGMRDLQVTTCKLGAAGWLYWTFDTHEQLASQSSFFMLDDGGGAINGQLAPIARPDACNPAIVSPYRGAGTCNRVAPVPAPPAGTPAPMPKPRPRRAVSAARRGVRLTVWQASLRQVLRRGLRVDVRVPARGRLAIAARYRRRVIASTRLRARRAGVQHVQLHISRAGRTRLRRARVARVGVAVRFRSARGVTTTVRVPLTLRR